MNMVYLPIYLSLYFLSAVLYRFQYRGLIQPLWNAFQIFYVLWWYHKFLSVIIICLYIKIQLNVSTVAFCEKSVIDLKISTDGLNRRTNINNKLIKYQIKIPLGNIISEKICQ